jgi:hypothetical protein
VFPSEQLGKEVDLLQQLKSGALDISTPSMPTLNIMVPAFEMPSAPFLWKDWKEAEAVIRGAAMEPIWTELKDKHNIVPLTKIWYWGWRNFTFTSKEVRKPEDMAGLKVRVPESPIWVEMVRGFGAAPTPIPFGEVYTALQQKTVDGQENALVISDIDCGNDYGFMSSLVECIKMSEIPIVCICDDRYSQSIKPILNYCYDVKLVKPTYDEIYALIYKVVTTEQIKIGLSQIKKLIEQSNGDIRFILNSLQMNIKSKTESGDKNITTTNIFDTTGQLFSNTTGIDDKFNIYWLSHDIHTLMVQENYINNTMNISCPVKKLTNLCESAASLSDADLFDSMINGCNWEFESYVALTTVKATSGCSKKGHIKFPQFFGKIATINKNRREKLSRFTNIK